VAKEEKTHVGEFQALLLKEDKEQEKELKEGKKEVEALMK
jgi:rubrerythrin